MLNQDDVSQVQDDAGDSGGPLLHAFAPSGNTSQGIPWLDVIVGITSFGEDNVRCGTSRKPGVYTRVSAYLNWIEEEMSGTESQAPNPGVAYQAQGPGIVSGVSNAPLLAPAPSVPEDPAAQSEDLFPKGLEPLPSIPNPEPLSPATQRELDKVVCYIHGNELWSMGDYQLEYFILFAYLRILNR